MKKIAKLRLLLVGLCVGIIIPFSASAVTWNVDGGGQLLGANDVIVGSYYYDVTFLYGSCVSLFDGCDNAEDFMFPSSDAANEAAQALLDQVLVDNSIGNFDSMPGLIAGMDPFLETAIICTPYDGLWNPLQVEMWAVWNHQEPASLIPDHLELEHFGRSAIKDCTTGQVWAVWSNARSVPEPSTLLLLCSGLVGLVSMRKRFKS